MGIFEEALQNANILRSDRLNAVSDKILRDQKKLKNATYMGKAPDGTDIVIVDGQIQPTSGFTRISNASMQVGDRVSVRSSNGGLQRIDAPNKPPVKVIPEIILYDYRQVQPRLEIYWNIFIDIFASDGTPIETGTLFTVRKSFDTSFSYYENRFSPFATAQSFSGTDLLTYESMSSYILKGYMDWSFDLLTAYPYWKASASIRDEYLDNAYAGEYKQDKTDPAFPDLQFQFPLLNSYIRFGSSSAPPYGDIGSFLVVKKKFTETTYSTGAYYENGVRNDYGMFLSWAAQQTFKKNAADFITEEQINSGSSLKNFGRSVVDVYFDWQKDGASVYDL